MLEIVLRPEAEADIGNIADYTEESWGTAQAKNYISAIFQKIEQLASLPNLGSAVDGLAGDYRKMPSGSHHIYYRIAGQHLIVVRILHERMDVEGNL